MNQNQADKVLTPSIIGGFSTKLERVPIVVVDDKYGLVPLSSEYQVISEASTGRPVAIVLRGATGEDAMRVMLDVRHAMNDSRTVRQA